ncbi:hypothetical protein D3C71_2070750 [compost metagenome]
MLALRVKVLSDCGIYIRMRLLKANGIQATNDKRQDKQVGQEKYYWVLTSSQEVEISYGK